VSDHYGYRVTWSEEDGEWVGACIEFPSLSHLDADTGRALAGIQVLVNAVVADMRANGEAVPEPLSARTYSGKFMARVPPDLHRRLVFEAAEANVSLNLLVTNRLSTRETDIYRVHEEDGELAEKLATKRSPQPKRTPKTSAKRRAHAA